MLTGDRVLYSSGDNYFVVLRNDNVYIYVDRKTLKIVGIISVNSEAYRKMKYNRIIDQEGFHFKCKRHVTWADGVIICETCNEVIDI